MLENWVKATVFLPLLTVNCPRCAHFWISFFSFDKNWLYIKTQMHLLSKCSNRGPKTRLEVCHFSSSTVCDIRKSFISNCITHKLESDEPILVSGTVSLACKHKARVKQLFVNAHAIAPQD